jgi:hypothetical protein
VARASALGNPSLRVAHAVRLRRRIAASCSRKSTSSGTGNVTSVTRAAASIAAAITDSGPVTECRPNDLLKLISSSPGMLGDQLVVASNWNRERNHDGSQEGRKLCICRAF